LGHDGKKGGRQRAEGRGQKAEGRRQRAEGRGKRLLIEGRGQRAEGRRKRLRTDCSLSKCPERVFKKYWIPPTPLEKGGNYGQKSPFLRRI